MNGIDLNYLLVHWGPAYKIRKRLGRWEASRRDDGALVRADTAEELLREIRDDYAVRPVPRDVQRDG